MTHSPQLSNQSAACRGSKEALHHALAALLHICIHKCLKSALNKEGGPTTSAVKHLHLAPACSWEAWLQMPCATIENLTRYGLWHVFPTTHHSNELRLRLKLLHSCNSWWCEMLTEISHTYDFFSLHTYDSLRDNQQWDQRL